MNPNALAERIEAATGLDPARRSYATVARKLIPKGLVKDTLSGTWLGHPLHPLLTDIPIGSFTSATVLDLIGGKQAQPAANTLVGLGLLSAVPTAAAGLADWSDREPGEQRVGVVHAAANVVGLAFYAASFAARRRGRRVSASTLGLIGMGTMSIGGYLGGHLSFGRGVGVNNAFWQEQPKEWTVALDHTDLPDRQAVEAHVDDVGVLLYKVEDRILAIGDRCSHAGGPLHEGTVDDDSLCVTCPWHASVFSLEDGHVVHGPAVFPAVSYETRVADGKIEIRVR